MAEARTLSRNADIQTDETDEFPPLFLDRANKQIRTNVKTQHTRLINRIERHMAELGSLTELNFMRRNLANQLEEYSHKSNSVHSTSSRQKTTHDLSRELAEEKIARQNLQIELQRLQSNIAQINQQYANEAAIRTQTINEIAEDNRKLAAWLKERNEALALEQQQRQDLETGLKGDIRNRQRLLEDEKVSRQTAKNHFKRELEARIGELATAFDKKLALYTSNSLVNTAEQNNKETGAKPKQQTFRTMERVDEEHGENKQEFIDSQKWSVNQTCETSVNSKNLFSVFRLPKLDLQPFDGDSKKWADFIAIYRDLVHQNSSISTTQNMAILKQCLTQDIRDGLGDSLSSPALYEKALRELEETYGHPQLVSRSYIQSLINLPKLNMNDYKSLLKASQNINGSVASLKSGGYEKELYSVTLMELVHSKMPLDIQNFVDWLHAVVKGEMMAKHCQIKIERDQHQQRPKTGRQKDPGVRFPPKINTILPPQQQDSQEYKSKEKDQAEVQTKKLICLLCKQDHRLAQCPKFSTKSLEERAQFIKSSGCCIKCLSKGHMVKEYCEFRHHSLMHGAPRISWRNQESEKAPPQTEKSPLHKKEEKKLVATHFVDGAQITTLLQVVPVTVEHNGNKFDTFALLDPGNEASLILQNLAVQLKIDGPTEIARLGTFHGVDPEIKTTRVTFNIFPRDQSRTFTVKNAYAVPKLEVTSRKINWPALKHQWKHLNDLDFPFIDSNKVSVLLGSDVMRVHDVLDVRIPPEGIEAPDGIRTHFGWCLTGPVPTSMLQPHDKSPPKIFLGYKHLVSQKLEDAVTQFWLTESFGVNSPAHPPMSHEDKKALSILNKTICHTGERYEVALMLRNETLNLPSNREVALRHLHSLERRFEKDAIFAKNYARVVEEYISLGYAIPAPSTPVPHGQEWILPHHGVRTAAKPGKVRVVFNPSTKHRGMSLNDQLFKGPDLLTGLIGVILRFRMLPVPISGDIEKMYHQVQVPKHQQSLLKFLWRTPGSKDTPTTYQMTVHTFGAVSSPTTCIFALRRTAEDFGHFYPNVVNKVLSNIYVDNYLDCTETEEEAITLRQEVSALLKLGGFNMVQWLSSSRSVLATVDKNDLSRSLDLDADRLPIERTLGMLWDCQADIFIFKTSTRTAIKTKREVLQEISSIYDPMGFLSPVIMVAKILMQDVWRAGINWDDTLPPNLLSVWKAWATELEFIARLKIPRCFRKHRKPLEYELHVFTDASEAGFGACIYIRAKYSEENFALNLFLAKARVAPLRQLSIPRLELQAAVLGARLCSTAVKELGPIASNVIYWCDSQTVLQWIYSTKCKYHAFVAHRITEIADTSKSSQWRHIPGNLNPADDCSRGIPATHLTTQHRWLRGPDFLTMPEANWPSPIFIDEPSPDDVEVVPEKYVGSFLIKTPHPIYTLIQNSSNIITIKRIAAWLLRFLTNFNLSSKNLPRIGQSWLIPADIREATNLIIKVDQAHHLQMELDCVKRRKPVPATSKLASLSPTLDTCGVMRVGGRLQHASISEFAKHPIILDPTSQLSTMLIREVHERLKHASTEFTLYDLRQQYHVLRPRASIRRIIRDCFTCKLRNSKPDPPLMGPFPATRLQSHLLHFLTLE
ncbi:uncharacterized protein LOC123467324 [Daphnia magna]|uniref:uncharacterized protein LOC123467324 n=1 Tax=Daphnia magna TaxID=35525 RepID=UPI001E1BB090|nr:uncharacterized protein LOC123467324 [Daphnia magna]